MKHEVIHQPPTDPDDGLSVFVGIGWCVVFEAALFLFAVTAVNVAIWAWAP